MEHVIDDGHRGNLYSHHVMVIEADSLDSHFRSNTHHNLSYTALHTASNFTETSLPGQLITLITSAPPHQHIAPAANLRVFAETNLVGALAEVLTSHHQP